MDTLFSFKYMRIIVASIGVLLIILVGAQTAQSLNIFTPKTDYATVNVEGVAEVTAVPDIGSFNFTVEAEDKEVTKAQEDSGKKINDIMSYLKSEGGVAEKDIKTTGYNTYPRYEYNRSDCPFGNCPNKRVLKGYVVTQNVRVKVRDITKAGELVAGVGSRGATNLSNLSFTVDDIEGKKEEARLLAIKDAKEKAQRLAKELDVRLGDIISFNDSNNNVYPVAYSEGRAVSADSLGFAEPTPQKVLAPDIAVGEDTITAHVTITYKIK